MHTADFDSKVEQFQKLINECKNIVFFGGAGVSTASGIPDFRSESGLYNNDNNKWKYTPETMLSHSFFTKHTLEFFQFYKEVMCVLGYKPNETHYKIAELEKAGKLKAVITQNIDGLHQLAGSEKVLELHGSIHTNKCMWCNKEFTAGYVKESIDIPRCDKCIDEHAIVKPDVVLYEEQLPHKVVNKAVKAISHADMLIVAGTSLTVYPAAGLIDNFIGKYIVLVNKSSTDQDYRANLVINDDMTEVFKNIHC